MYLRFTTQFINEEDRPQNGIFHAMVFIRDHKLTHDDDASTLKELSLWFKKYLEVPDWFINDNREYGVKAKALSWFKDSAKEHILKIQDLILVLEKYNITVERVTSRKPGHIVYEDDYQVSAIPFKTDRKKVL